MALFSVHPSLPFFETALTALVSGTLLPKLNSPLSLKKITVFVPSRHAADTFAHMISTYAYPRPNIISLGQLPEGFESADLPPAFSPQRLHLLVAKRIQNRMMEKGEPVSLSTAYNLGQGLLHFLDTLTLNHISAEHIFTAQSKGLEDASGLLSLMLDILLNEIPKILESQGAVTSLQRAHMQMKRYEERLRTRGSPHPVVILGSTGSQLSTHKLMKLVSSLPNGIVILPGVDYESTEDIWLTYDAHPTHPQMLLSRFVKSCDQTRTNVISIDAPPLSPVGSARASLLAHALTIPEKTEVWAEEGPRHRLTYKTALEGLTVAVARNERHEATLIARALHDARCKGAQRPTLMTPDRLLADYTAQELKRWSEPVVMSPPSSLSHTLAGRLALLSLALLNSHFSPATVSSLLAHPWVTLNLDAVTYKTCIPLWDMLFLRHLPPKGGLELLLTRIGDLQDSSHGHHGLDSLPRGFHDTYSVFSPHLKEALSHGMTTLVMAYSSWTKEQSSGTLHQFIKSHISLLERLTAMNHEEMLARYPEAKALFDLFDAHMNSDLSLSLEEYKALLELMLRDTPVFQDQKKPEGSCIQIIGLWEARFLTPDYVVLGGLTETVWPPSTSIDPIFGRTLAATLGLPSPEIRIGQSAHDFAQALCRTPQTLITYSRKRNNAPTLPSRFLLRIHACLGDTLWSQAQERGEQLYKEIDTFEKSIHDTVLECKGRSSSPLPQRLPIPETLSTQALERLISDPHAFFSQHVLGLAPLPERTLTVDLGTYGSLIHNIFSSFAQSYPKDLPPDPLKALLSIGSEVFAPLKRHDHAVDMLWRSKFQHVAAAFIAWEEKRRPFIESIFVSTPGRVILKTVSGSLAVSTLTDRVEKRHDGTYTLIDFKTGTLPSLHDIHTGTSLSLVLQAIALEQGRLGSLPRDISYHLTYVHTSPGLKGFEERTIYPPKESSSLSEFITLLRGHLEQKVNDYMTTPVGVFS